jgi:hypothetical protein
MNIDVLESTVKKGNTKEVRPSIERKAKLNPNIKELYAEMIPVCVDNDLHFLMWYIEKNILSTEQ